MTPESSEAAHGDVRLGRLGESPVAVAVAALLVFGVWPIDCSISPRCG